MLCLNIEEEKHYLRQRKRGNAVMSEERKVLHQRIVVNLVVTLAALLAVFFLGPKLFRFFLPIIIAWIIAMITNPLVSFLEKRIKIMRKHGSVIVIVLILAVGILLTFRTKLAG